MTSAQTYSILITDDDPTVRETLRDIVAPEGYHTLLADSGEEALEVIRRHEVHLALMDMHLPRLSGLDTLALVRQFRISVPAILMTADHDDNLIRRALSEHAFCVLAKPISRHTVIYVVHRAFEKYYHAPNLSGHTHANNPIDRGGGAGDPRLGGPGLRS